MPHDPIVKSVEIACTPQHAFDVFVRRMSDWWPLDSHAVSAASGKPAQSVTIEPRVGGAVYETTHDGTRADWGKVLEFEPGRKLAMTWHPGNSADAATRVEVDFAEEGGMTRVTLTHSGWEVWGAEAAARRDNYDGGWDFVLGDCFAGAAA